MYCIHQEGDIKKVAALKKGREIFLNKKVLLHSVNRVVKIAE